MRLSQQNKLLWFHKQFKPDCSRYDMVPNRKIKVCHVITRLIRGGAQENTVLTVNGLSMLCDVTLIGGPGKGPRQSITDDIDEQVKVVVIPEMQRAVNPIKDIIAFWKLYKLFRQEQFTIVHTHSTQA